MLDGSWVKVSKGFIATAPERTRTCYSYNNDPWCQLFEQLKNEGVQEESVAEVLINKAHLLDEILTTVQFVGENLELKKQIIIRIMNEKNSSHTAYYTAYNLVVGKNSVLREFLISLMTEDIRNGKSEIFLRDVRYEQHRNNPRKIAELELEYRDQLDLK